MALYIDHLDTIFGNFTHAHSDNNASMALEVDRKIDPCHFEKHDWLEAKLILISICGTTVAILGVLGNMITIIVLSRPGMRTPNNLYLIFLAIFDTLLLIAAIILYSIEYIFEYLDSLPLYNFWIKFVRYGFAMSHVAQTGSVYITVAVTFERYLAVLYPRMARTMCTHDRTVLIIALVIGFAILFNCTKYFELEIIYNNNCTGFAAERLVQSALLGNPIYQTVHSLWLTQMIMVFIPFTILFFVNTAIVCKVRRSLKRLSWIQRGRKRNQLKEKSRDATKVLVVIVLVFLICNSWGFVITLCENVYTDKKLREWWPEFYAFSREAINFLAIVNSSINFVIYCIFGKDFRRELISVWGCTGQIMLPSEDRFTAEQLMGSPARRRPSLFVRYLNLVTHAQMQKDNGRKFSSEENLAEKGPSSSAKKRSSVPSLVFSRRSLPQPRRSRLSDICDKKGRGSWKKATISSGDCNHDFVSVGQEDASVATADHRTHSNGFIGSVLLEAKDYYPMGDAISRPTDISDSIFGGCQGAKLTDDSVSPAPSSKLSPDAEPLAPFLLGMLVSSASSMRQAGIESALMNFREDT